MAYKLISAGIFLWSGRAGSCCGGSCGSCNIWSSGTCRGERYTRYLMDTFIRRQSWSNPGHGKHSWKRMHALCQIQAAKSLGQTVKAFKPTYDELVTTSQDMKSTLESSLGIDDVRRSLSSVVSFWCNFSCIAITRLILKSMGPVGDIPLFTSSALGQLKGCMCCLWCYADRFRYEQLGNNRDIHKVVSK